jgi:hypothetical protein
MSLKGLSAASLIMLGALGTGSVAVAIAGTGVALAGSSTKTVHACVSKSGGAVRFISKSKRCKSKERSMTLNKRGPRGRQGPAGTTGTFQMYANVDGSGNLGSNFDAVSAIEVDPGTPTPSYTVTFNHPIGSCAAVAQNGFAGGALAASGYPTRVVFDAKNPDAFDVQINENADPSEPVSQAFMIVVTCKR